MADPWAMFPLVAPAPDDDYAIPGLANAAQPSPVSRPEAIQRPGEARPARPAPAARSSGGQPRAAAPVPGGQPQPPVDAQPPDPWSQFPMVETSAASGRFAQPSLTQPIPQPPMDNMDTLRDVVTAGGAGLIRGGLGLAGLPGSVEWLGRAGINAGVKATGLSQGDVVSPQNALPSGSDIIGGFEKTVGKLYQPKSTAGEYARTIGEFAPGMLFPGTFLQKLVGNVLMPALTSETAGQATKGSEYEQWARVGGALLGGVAPGIGGRTISPNITPAEKLKHVATLDKEKVRLLAGDRGANAAMRYAEDATLAIPFAGGSMKRIKQGQAEDFTEAALKRAGVQNQRLATPEVIDRAFTAIGRKFDDLAARTSISATSLPLKAIPQISKRYTAETNALKRDPRVALIADEIDATVQAGTTIQGRQYAKLRSDLETAARETVDATTARAFRNISRALDVAVEKSMNNPALRKEWRDTRGDYRKLLTIRDASLRAGEKSADGIISPANLASAAKAQGRAGYARGNHPYEDLAQAGVSVMSPLPNSGTAQRAMAQGLLTLGGAGAVGGSGSDAVMGGVGGLIAGAIGGRVLMSKPVQRVLSNQVGATVKGTSGAHGKRAAFMEALMQAERGTKPLEVSIYPNGDPRNRR